MKLGIDSEKKISDLFSSRNQYRIPIYQRRYVWDTANWEALWRDFIQLQRRIDNGETDKKHFTGTVITYAEEEADHQADWKIIDGQQRLTTFQIIFCVIRDLCASDAYPLPITSNIQPDVEDFIKLRRIQAIGESSLYRLFPTAHDRKAFLSVVDGELGKQIREAAPNLLEKFQSLVDTGQSNWNRIITAYGYFGTKITSYLADKGHEKLLDITRTFSENFRVIKIDLDDTDEPEKIFETINDTGRMLDDFDYLRNHLFLRFRKLPQSLLEGLYKEHWEKFEKWNTEKQDLFFRAFLVAKLGPECFELEGKTVKPFDRYREYSNALTEVPSHNTEYSDALQESLRQNERPLSQVEYELGQLSYYADSYQMLSLCAAVTKASDLRTLGNRMQFYDNLNLSRLDSFILFLQHKLVLSEEHLHIVCDILESYIIRCGLCLDAISSYKIINKCFSEAIETGDFCVKRFAETLQNTLPGSVKEALNQAWSKDINLILYILYRIELYKREQCSGSSYAPLDFKGLKARERIASPADCDSTKIKSIGNITPLLSASPYDWDFYTIKAKKKVLITEFAHGLRLSEEIHAANGWDENPANEISRRAADLLLTFDNIWKPVLGDYV